MQKGNRKQNCKRIRCFSSLCIQNDKKKGRIIVKIPYCFFLFNTLPLEGLPLIAKGFLAHLSFACSFLPKRSMKRKGGIARFRVLPFVSLLSFDKGFLVFHFSKIFKREAMRDFNLFLSVLTCSFQRKTENAE